MEWQCVQGMFKEMFKWISSTNKLNISVSWKLLKFTFQTFKKFPPLHYNNKMWTLLFLIQLLFSHCTASLFLTLLCYAFQKVRGSVSEQQISSLPLPDVRMFNFPKWLQKSHWSPNVCLKSVLDFPKKDMDQPLKSKNVMSQSMMSQWPCH